MADYKDGALYARGDVLFVSPKESAEGISMGGPIAECQDQDTAEELAKLYNREKRLGRYAAGYDNAVTDYWHEHYVEKGLCAVCGNHGYLDTTGTRSPAGVEVGGRMPCFCPNGQNIRRHDVI